MVPVRVDRDQVMEGLWASFPGCWRLVGGWEQLKALDSAERGL